MLQISALPIETSPNTLLPPYLRENPAADDNTEAVGAHWLNTRDLFSDILKRFP
jgi:hypothetical protein